jgi:hypothetical protein
MIFSRARRRLASAILNKQRLTELDQEENKIKNVGIKNAITGGFISHFAMTITIHNDGKWARHTGKWNIY